MNAHSENGTPLSVYERRLPPISEVATAVIAIVVTSGIYLANYLPRRAPLGLAFALLAVAAMLLAWNIVSLSRIQDFAWDTFFLVGRWALLAYLVIAGMLEYVFVLRHPWWRARRADPDARHLRRQHPDASRLLRLEIPTSEPVVASLSPDPPSGNAVSFRTA